jgi:hypothetical protein
MPDSAAKGEAIPSGCDPQTEQELSNVPRFMPGRVTNSMSMLEQGRLA